MHGQTVLAQVSGHCDVHRVKQVEYDRMLEYDRHVHSHPDMRVSIGEGTTVLAHLRNTGAVPLNVTSLFGAVYHPSALGTPIQNFTRKPLMVNVPAAAEATLDYRFRLHPQSPASELVMVHTVVYQSHDQIYTSTFFNRTITAVAKPIVIDLFSVLKILSALVALVGAARCLYKHAAKGKAWGRASCESP
jgi:hypothetical protein